MSLESVFLKEEQNWEASNEEAPQASLYADDEIEPDYAHCEVKLEVEVESDVLEQEDEGNSIPAAIDRRVRASYEQFQRLIEFMESQGDLAQLARPGSGLQGRVRSERLWKNLATQLNSVDGAVRKTPDRWKKVWADWKTKTKKKALFIRHLTDIGRRPSGRQVLSAMEKRVLTCMGFTIKQGKADEEKQGFDIPSQTSSPLRQESSELATPADKSNLDRSTIDAPSPQPAAPPPAPSPPASSPRPPSHRRRARRRPATTYLAFLALERRRLALEETRERNQHEREMERLRIEAERVRVYREVIEQLRFARELAEAWLKRITNK